MPDTWGSAMSDNFNAKISMRDLAETYGPPFEACIAAKPEQVMCWALGCGKQPGGWRYIRIYIIH